MSNEQGNNAKCVQDRWPPVDMSFMPLIENTDLDFLSDTSWANQPFQSMMGAPGGLPDKDVSFPDTSTYTKYNQTQNTNALSNILQHSAADTAVLQLAIRE
jgi:hypothetical protein